MALFRRGGKDPAPQDTVETEVDEPTVVDDRPSSTTTRGVTCPGRARPAARGTPRGRRRPPAGGPRRHPASRRAGHGAADGDRQGDRTSCPPPRSSWTAPRCRCRRSPHPAPTGIWDEIRAEIAESVTQQGGSADDLPGPFGRELLARLPVRTPEGRTGHRPARFIGADGPRWFVRGVLTGRAAVDPAAATALEQLFAGIVVVRGTDARAAARPAHAAPPGTGHTQPQALRRGDVAGGRRDAGGSRLRPADPRSGDHGDPMSLKELPEEGGRVPGRDRGRRGARRRRTARSAAPPSTS